jgi:hypothetical protein
LSKNRVVSVLGLALVLTAVLAGSIQSAHAQQNQIVIPGGSVSMWTTQGYYGYGQEVYVTIYTNQLLHRAHLEIRQRGGPSYRIDLGRLWPGQYTIDVGQSDPPAARVNFMLFDGWQQVAYASCGTGP